MTLCQCHPSRSWFLRCDELYNFWDLFHISKFSDLANAYSLFPSSKILGQGHKRDFASWANSGGLVMATCSTALRKTQRLHLSSGVGALIRDVCHKHKLREQWCMQGTRKYYVLTKIIGVFPAQSKSSCRTNILFCMFLVLLRRLCYKSRRVMGKSKQTVIWELNILPGNGFYVLHVTFYQM